MTRLATARRARADGGLMSYDTTRDAHSGKQMNDGDTGEAHVGHRDARRPETKMRQRASHSSGAEHGSNRGSKHVDRYGTVLNREEGEDAQLKDSWNETIPVGAGRRNL